MPTREDRTEFLKILYEWSIGNGSNKLYGFFAHLTEHGRKDGLPFLDKDLLFCIDSIRLKVWIKQHFYLSINCILFSLLLKEISGEEVLKLKAQIVIDVYLDSQIPPSTQLDINHETQQKIFKSAVKITQGNITSAELSVFEETRNLLLKDLLPYWAGYKSVLTNEETEMPLSKQEKILKERLDEFLRMKNPSPNDFKLPPLSPTPFASSPSNLLNKHQSSYANQSINIVFSIATGIKYKDEKTGLNAGRSSILATNDRRNSNAIPIR